MKPRTYSDKMQDARWQKKRLEVLTDADWTCEACGTRALEEAASMHVHHKFYGFAKKREPWDYKRIDLMALCSECHDKMPRGNKEWENLVSSLCYFGADPRNIDDLCRSILGVFYKIAMIRASRETGEGEEAVVRRRLTASAILDFERATLELGAGDLIASLVDVLVGNANRAVKRK